MTKKEIVKRISEEAQLTQLKTKEIVQLTFDMIIETLEVEGRIELRNFGVFEVKRRKPRRARNPRTNEPVEVEAKNVVTFQPGKVMEDRIRKMTGPTPDAPRPGRSASPDDDDDDDDDDIPVPVGAAGEFAANGKKPRKPR
ncbi:MAG: HU family DNA-binding protein [Fimbriiglobus sp.]